MGKKSARKGTPRMYLVKNALLCCLCSSEFVTPRVPPVFYLSPVSTFNTFPWRLQTPKQRQTQGNSEPEKEKKKKKSSRRRLSVTREQHSWLALRTSRICTAIRLCLLLFVRGGGYGKAATTIIQGYVCLFVSLAMPQSDSGICCNLTVWRW